MEKKTEIPKFRILFVFVAITIIIVTLSIVYYQKKNKVDVPVITATEKIDNIQATLLTFNSSYEEASDSVYAWNADYSDDNIMIIDGKMGQNKILLSAQNPSRVSYTIYLSDGSVYDDGTRELTDSRSLRLFWEENHSRVGLIAPFSPGEYYYQVNIRWASEKLTVSYGFKVVMTGIENTYDKALDKVYNFYQDASMVFFLDTKLFSVEGNEDEYYIFDVTQSHSVVQVAVSKNLEKMYLCDGEENIILDEEIDLTSVT